MSKEYRTQYKLYICSVCDKEFTLLDEGNPYREYNAHKCEEVTV